MGRADSGGGAELRSLLGRESCFCPWRGCGKDFEHKPRYRRGYSHAESEHKKWADRCCYARRRAGNWSPAAEHTSRGRRGSFRRSSLSPRAFTVDCFYVRVDRSSELAEYERRNRQACPERDDQHQRNRDVEAGQCIDGQDGPRGHAHEQQTCTVVGQQVEGEQPLCGRRLRNGGIGCPVIVVGYPRLILNTKPRAQVWCIQRPFATKMRSIRSNTVPCG